MTSQLLPGVPPDYYAPRLEVRVGGTPLTGLQIADVLEVHVDLTLNEAGGATLTVNDWDDRTLWFKYSDSDVFATNQSITVALGYADKLAVVFTGRIRSMSPSFPESGAPTVTVGAQDALGSLALRQPVDGQRKNFAHLADWQVAQQIAQRNNLRIEVTRDGPTHPWTTQGNKDEFAFLKELAERNEFDLFVLPDPATGEPVLHFEKPRDGRDGRAVTVYQLTWGDNLISFTPRLSIARQVQKVTVRSTNPATGAAISATADARDLPPVAQGAESGPSKAEPGSTEIVVDKVVLTEEEAKREAVSRLTERARQFTVGTARLIGLADIRPGDNIELGGLPTRFAGRYLVKKVSHAFGGSGFTTDLDVERPRPERLVRNKAARS